MSVAEIFLLLWAGVATTLAVLYRGSAKNLFHHHKQLSILLAELASGEIQATQDERGMWTVENENMKMQFRSVKE